MNQFPGYNIIVNSHTNGWMYVYSHSCMQACIEQYRIEIFTLCTRNHNEFYIFFYLNRQHLVRQNYLDKKRNVLLRRLGKLITCRWWGRELLNCRCRGELFTCRCWEELYTCRCWEGCWLAGAEGSCLLAGAERAVYLPVLRGAVYLPVLGGAVFLALCL